MSLDNEQKVTLSKAFNVRYKTSQNPDLESSLLSPDSRRFGARENKLFHVRVLDSLNQIYYYVYYYRYQDPRSKHIEIDTDVLLFLRSGFLITALCLLLKLSGVD